MPTVKHKGPGLETIKRGIQTTILVSSEELDNLWPDFNNNQPGHPAFDTFITDLFDWIKNDRRYSLLKGIVEITGMSFPTTVHFDVSEEIVKLSLYTAGKHVYSVEINDEEFGNFEDIVYDEHYLNEDLILEYVNKSGIGNREIETISFWKKEGQGFKAEIIDLYKKGRARGVISKEMLFNIFNAIKKWEHYVPEEGEVLDRRELTTTDIANEADAIERIREFYFIHNEHLVTLQKVVEHASFKLVSNTYVLLMLLMRRFVTVPPQEVAGETKDRIIRERSIPTTYKYDGKVHLFDNRVLKLETTAAEKREFVRHIGRWLVRGHWRTYKETNKTIWIAQYEKGKEGTELEDRIYVELTK